MREFISLVEDESNVYRFARHAAKPAGAGAVNSLVPLSLLSVVGVTIPALLRSLSVGRRQSATRNTRHGLGALAGLASGAGLIHGSHVGYVEVALDALLDAQRWPGAPFSSSLSQRAQ
jgi:hypothetical protein